MAISEFLSSDLGNALVTYGGWVGFFASELAGIVKRRGIIFVIGNLFLAIGNAFLSFRKSTSEDSDNAKAFEKAFGKDESPK